MVVYLAPPLTGERLGGESGLAVYLAPPPLVGGGWGEGVNALALHLV